MLIALISTHLMTTLFTRDVEGDCPAMAGRLIRNFVRMPSVPFSGLIVRHGHQIRERVHGVLLSLLSAGELRSPFSQIRGFVGLIGADLNLILVLRVARVMVLARLSVGLQNVANLGVSVAEVVLVVISISIVLGLVHRGLERAVGEDTIQL